MPKSSVRERPPAGDLDLVFHALADPTRRSVVERLGRGPAATSVLAAPYPMALPSFIQHLDVLERSGLVTSHKQGRVRTYALVSDRLDTAQDWLETQRDLWSRRLDQLDAYLLTDRSTHAETDPPTNPPTNPQTDPPTDPMEKHPR